MAPNGSSKGKRKARANIPTSVINKRPSLDEDRIKEFMLEYICRPIPIYNVCGVKDERAWDLIYDIICLDPLTTCYFSLLQMIWPRHKSWSSPFREWWASFRSDMGQMFDTTSDQMNN